MSTNPAELDSARSENIGIKEFFSAQNAQIRHPATDCCISNRMLFPDPTHNTFVNLENHVAPMVTSILSIDIVNDPQFYKKLVSESYIRQHSSPAKKNESESETPPPEPILDLPLLKDLNELSNLKENWDSYGAFPIKKECICFALNCILIPYMRPMTPAPIIVPLNSGGLMFEWHQGGIDIEIRILPSTEVTIYYADVNNKEENEISLGAGADLSQLKDIFTILTQRNL